MILMYKPEMQVRISQTFFMGFSAILPILKTKGPSKFQDPTFLPWVVFGSGTSI